MSKVFISYQQADKDFANLLKSKLEQNGIDAWLAEDTLWPGQDWRKEIDDGIRASDALIVVMSEESRQSSYVTYEWAFALGVGGIRIIPVRLKPAEMHPRLQTLQSIDFSGKERPWEKLFNSIYAKPVPPDHGMRHDRDEIERLVNRTKEKPLPRMDGPVSGSDGSYDVLVVIDVQKDFCAGGIMEVPAADSLIAPLNEAIDKAFKLGMKIVFTCDRHPPDHCSFEEQGGAWPPHCLNGTPGSEYHDLLHIPDKSQEISIGVQSARPGYSPYEDSQMDFLINTPRVRTVYLTGIALEYCVQATALETRKRRKRVVACETLIRSAATDKDLVEEIWANLAKAGVERVQGFDPAENLRRTPRPWPVLVPSVGDDSANV